MQFQRLRAGLLATLTLTGCGLSPSYQTPVADPPGSFPQSAVASTFNVKAVTRRPLSDFLSTQGTFPPGVTFLPGPPAIPNQLGWSEEPQDATSPKIFAMVDYAGKAAQVLAGFGVNLGTTVDGQILEQPLADGTAKITVQLQTDNALAWASTPDYVPPGNMNNKYDDDPLLFGARPAEILAGAKPVVGRAKLSATFIIPAPGAPIPDLIQLLNDPLLYDQATARDAALKSLQFEATIKGYRPDGSKATLHILQRALSGLQNNKVYTVGPLAGGRDFFPGEVVKIQP